MPKSRIIRQQALQLLCQFDAGNSEVASITEVGFDEETSETTEPLLSAFTVDLKSPIMKLWIPNLYLLPCTVS